MGIHKFIQAVAAGDPIPMYGDGTQSRDFTYVDDTVQANVLAALSAVSGEVFNVGGGTRIVLRDLLAAIEEAVGQRAQYAMYYQVRMDHAARVIVLLDDHARACSN